MAVGDDDARHSYKFNTLCPSLGANGIKA